jgi:hypothetical protein
MSTATITRLYSGGATFEHNGITQIRPDWRAAADEADVRGIPWVLAEPPAKREAAEPVTPT